MKKVKYRYNQATLSYEPIRIPLKVRVLRTFALLCTIFISSLVLYFLVGTTFDTPKEKALHRELDQMEFRYARLTDRMEVTSKVLENLHDRDSRVYEIVFGMEPVDRNVWEGGVGGHEKFSDVVNYGETTQIIKDAQSKMDKLERQLVIQSQTVEGIEDVASNREEMMACIPSIKPVRIDKLKRDLHLLSGYGLRMHPIHKVVKSHKGIDFTCSRGTPIQASGNGTVIKVRKKRTGYGKSITIDHGFGYQTLYAHCQSILVKEGEKVFKGQKIATVGNTGTSTAPHLHYEVHFKGKAVDPIHYCMDDLTPEEYKELVDMASVVNQSFD